VYPCVSNYIASAPERRGESRGWEDPLSKLRWRNYAQHPECPSASFCFRFPAARSQVRGDKTRLCVVEQVRQWDDRDVYGAITASEVDWPCGNDPPANWNESYRSRLQPACIHLLVAAAEAIDCERAFVWERIVRMKVIIIVRPATFRNAAEQCAPRCSASIYTRTLCLRVYVQEVHCMLYVLRCVLRGNT